MWIMSGLFLPGILLLGYALPDDDVWTAAGRTGTSAGRRPVMMFMARLLTEIAAAIGLRGPPVDSWSPPAYQMAVI